LLTLALAVLVFAGPARAGDLAPLPAAPVAAPSAPVDAVPAVADAAPVAPSSVAPAAPPASAPVGADAGGAASERLAELAQAAPADLALPTAPKPRSLSQPVRPVIRTVVARSFHRVSHRAVAKARPTRPATAATPQTRPHRPHRDLNAAIRSTSLSAGVGHTGRPDEVRSAPAGTPTSITAEHGRGALPSPALPGRAHTDFSTSSWVGSGSGGASAPLLAFLLVLFVYGACVVASRLVAVGVRPPHGFAPVLQLERPG
jgi:hypothetical protein